MAIILIIYGTTEGHTAAIAECMREAIAGRGHQVTVERAASLQTVPDHADGVLVGASIHAGRHQRAVREFAQRNRERLEGMPSGFFQVCLAAVETGPGGAAKTQAIIDKFIDETGWRPAVAATFPGMLAWTRYGFFTRLLMKLILRNKSLAPEELDTSRDVDYTDYDAVRRITIGFASVPSLIEKKVDAATAFWNAEGVVLKARGVRIELEHPVAGRLPMVASPMRFSGTPLEHKVAPPLLGEHTEPILRELLGKTAAEIAQLRAGDVI